MATESNNNDFILLYNREKKIKMEDFIERNHIYGIKAQELFDQNKELIWQQYTETDKKNEEASNGKWPTSANDLTVNSYLPAPCSLRINPSKITRELAISQINAQVNTEDYYAFADEKLQEVFQDEGYTISDNTKRSPTCSVIGWFKSLYYIGLNVRKDPIYKQKFPEFSDLSRHIISLSTSVGANGGSFVMRLPIISMQGGAVVRVFDSGEEKLGGYLSKNDASYEYGDNGEYYVKSSFDDIEGNYFNWLISSNDLLFISFEKLDMELIRQTTDDIYNSDTDTFEIGTKLAEGIYDMIGLVDEVKVVTNPQNSDGYVEVTGRDLMKLLIDDGSFFFSNANATDPSTVFANENSSQQGDIKGANFLNENYNNPINRLRLIGGEIEIFKDRYYMEISYILKGVMSRLANVEIVPSYVFDSWGNERTKYIDLEPEKKES